MLSQTSHWKIIKMTKKSYFFMWCLFWNIQDKSFTKRPLFIKIISFKCICNNQPVMNILSQTLQVKNCLYVLQGSFSISILTNDKSKSKVHVEGCYWVFIKILFSNHPPTGKFQNIIYIIILNVYPFFQFLPFESRIHKKIGIF